MTQIHRIEVPIPLPAQWVNCYFIEDSTPTLIDPGVNTDEALEAITSAVAETGTTLGDLQRIILTHGHMDHAGLAGRLAELSHAEVFIHPSDFSTITGPGPQLWERARSFRRFLFEAGVPESLREGLIEPISLRYKTTFSALSSYAPVKGGEIFPLDDFDLEVIHTAGHSPGSVCLFDGENGTLFSGDTLLEEVTCNPSTIVDGPEETSTDRILSACRNSLELIENLPVKRVLPGHGLPFSDHRKRIRMIREHHEKRRKEILRLLEQLSSSRGEREGVTSYVLAQGLFPSMVGIEYFYRCCAIRVHLDALEQEGLVERQNESAPLAYGLR